MQDIVERLAQTIYWADVSLVVVGGHDCRFCLCRRSTNPAIPDAITTVPYRDLPNALKEDYFAIASTAIRSGRVQSDWYERMGVKRPTTALTESKGASKP